jgi:hypothetical protein
MSVPTERSLPDALDRAEAEGRWLASLPAEVREHLLRPADVKRLLDEAERFIESGSVDVLAELEADTYRLAIQIDGNAGMQAALRYLRDGLGTALCPCVQRSSECAKAGARIIARVSDAVWQAHTDALQGLIERQQLDRLQQELMVAKRIQERLLPRTTPELEGWDIAGRVLPAAEVGGDYWSCKLYAEDDIVTFKLADVTGHGIAAATLVAAVKFISGGYYRGAKTAAQVMERTNSVLVRETPHEILVTMVYGWLYPHGGAINVVNAGHSPVLHLRKGQLRRIPTTGIALGMIETQYREMRLTMDPGDVFLTCSDGVTQPGGDGPPLGEAWVEEQLLAGAAGPAEELVQRILDGALHAYGRPIDDMSVLVVKRTG